MEDELAALAAGGAAAVVAAMATDGWESVRAHTSAVFRRLGARHAEAADRQLEHHDEQVRASDAPDRARRALLGAWTLEFAELLRDAPEFVEPLRALVAQCAGDLPPDRRRWMMEQVNTASGYGRVFAVQSGNLYVHGEPRRGVGAGPSEAPETVEAAARTEPDGAPEENDVR